MGDVIYLAAKETEKMISVFEVARYFLGQGAMNHKKLQKLCYYAQAWYLALQGRPLMNTWFEAWVHGPVSPELYSRYREWGGLTIPQIFYSGEMCTEYRDFLNKIYVLYGDYSGNELEQLTHKERPWLNAREGYSADEICTAIIKNEDMRDFYKEYLH